MNTFVGHIHTFGKVLSKFRAEINSPLVLFVSIFLLTLQPQEPKPSLCLLSF